MSVEELANVVMNELSLVNSWLLVLTVICIVTVVLVVRKLKEQQRHIDELERFACDVSKRLYKHH